MYVAVVALLDVDQPKNFFVPFVNAFAVNALDTSYVCVTSDIEPVAPVAFALYLTVYVFAVQLGVAVLLPLIVYPVLQSVV